MGGTAKFCEQSEKKIKIKKELSLWCSIVRNYYK